MTLLRIADGEYVVKEGERGTDLFFVVSGVVRCEYETDNNEQHVLITHEQGQVIPTPPRVLGRISPIFPPFFPVFCAFSPPRRGGSNEPQAGTQGQETAGKGTKRGELRPSFDTPDAVGRITCWYVLPFR